MKPVDWVPPKQLIHQQHSLKKPSPRDRFNAELRRRLVSIKLSVLPRRQREVEVSTLSAVLPQGTTGAPSLPAVLSPTTVVSTQPACKESVPQHTQNSTTVHTPSVFNTWEIQLKTRTEQLEENPRGQSIWCKIPYTNPDNDDGSSSPKVSEPGKMDRSK